MTRPASSVLGKLSVERFLKVYWQRKPRLVRGAFPGLKDPLSPDELAGLACEPDVDSRLVIARGGREPWQVIRGPQKPRALRKLPRSQWTLLVESVDRYSPEIAALASAFSFLPNWRKDDVMVSLAPKRGTVGAHIDSYDVFLIQGQGRRKWEVDSRATADYRPGLDLRILKRFHPQDAWTLEPGDMLYVPPGVGHRGVTVRSDAEVALTYSVGFRAPSSADLLSVLLSRALARERPALFRDAGRNAVSDPGELSPEDLAGLRQFLVADLEFQPPDAWALAVGEAVTAGGRTRSSGHRVDLKSVARRLAGGTGVSPVPPARTAWARLQRGRAAFFVNGEGRVLPREHAFAAALLCGRASGSAARRLATNPGLVLLVVELLRAGVVDWVD